MNSNKIDIKSMYSDVKPDEWAVTRMRATLRREQENDLYNRVGFVFKRYVLAFSVVMLVLMLVLDRNVNQDYTNPADEVITWVFGEQNVDDHLTDIPEFTFLTDY